MLYFSPLLVFLYLGLVTLKKKILFCHFMTLSVEVVVNVYVLSIMPNEKLPLLVFNLFYILKYDLFLVYFIFRFFVRFSKPKRKF